MVMMNFFSQLIFFLLFQFQFLSVTSYTPIENFAINCGSSDSYTSTSDNRKWSSDDGSNNPIFLLQDGQKSVTSTEIQVPPSLEKAPYATARLSRSEFTYSFNVTPGQKFVRLFFYPASSYSPSFDRFNALFSVKAGHHTLLKDFNASLTADNDDDPGVTVFREYCINVEPRHRLNITFIPNPTTAQAYAFINGIEVVSMPTNLYTDGKLFELAGTPVRVDNQTALETVRRINVGGSEIFADHDNGMLRSWDDDSGYLVTQNTQTMDESNSKLIDPDGLQEYIAPGQVYLTARTAKYNMTWQFEVDSDFVYMIRLHFCELDQNVIAKGDRVFQVLIDDSLADSEVDVVDMKNSNLFPVYKDYAVRLKNQGSLRRMNFSIKLQKHQKSKSEFVILSGIEIFKVSDGSDNLGGANPEAKILPEWKNSKKSRKTPIIIAVVCAAIAAIVFSVLCFFIFRRKARGDRANRMPCEPSDLCRYFSITEIRAATNNFDDLSIIGVGGFGNVYKGHISSKKTSIPVAIKRLKPDSQQGLTEFQTEINMLSEFRHPHLVPLIGYCNDGKEMILVYEFMSRGTLRDHLYDSDNQPLPWKRRLEICVGAAKGLLYLHTSAGENKQSVIHRDVKSTNILLDEHWVAKVSDFGLSKIGPTGLSRSHITTDVKGSLGYMDPEYYMSLRLTHKSDVYSFGVVLLEVLCGRPPLNRKVEKEREGSLVEWVRRCYENGEIDNVVDPVLKGTISPQCLNKFVGMALSCLQEHGKHRPLMVEVVKTLESALQMQGRMEGPELYPCYETSINSNRITSNRKTSLENQKITEGEIEDTEESGVQFSTSDGSMSESKSSSKTTITSTSTEEEKALVPGGVFSELANPTAR